MKAFVLVLCLLAQDPQPGRQATVGMRSRIDELVLPGTELIAAPAVAKAPVVLRVLAVRAHGDAFRYDLEWSGLEAGTHDLAKFLVRKDGSALAGLPAIPVVVKSVLPKQVKEPGELTAVEPPRLGGYSTLQWWVGGAWVVGLLAILLFGRKWRRKAAVLGAQPTLADRLRPIVEAVAAGRADEAAKAELERLLLAFWRHRLGLQDEKAGAAIAAIKQHAEAGALMRQLEVWLHMPNPPQAVDLQALLAPYRSVSAADFEALVKPVEVR